MCIKKNNVFRERKYISLYYFIQKYADANYKHYNKHCKRS